MYRKGIAQKGSFLPGVFEKRFADIALFLKKISYAGPLASGIDDTMVESDLRILCYGELSFLVGSVSEATIFLQRLTDDGLLAPLSNDDVADLVDKIVKEAKLATKVAFLPSRLI